jgi:predicted enzyme related to lactoylglutathione lyase
MAVKVAATRFVLAVPSLDQARADFCDILGFTALPSPPGWLFVELDGAVVMIGECVDDLAPAETGSHSYFGYFEIDDLEAYAREIAARGAKILSPPADKPWGMREMPVRTAAGHRIMFGQPSG